MTTHSPRTSFFIYIDSDAFIRNQRLSFAAFMSRARLTNQSTWEEQTHKPSRTTNRCRPTSRGALDSSMGPIPTIWTWVNTPWGCRASTGTFVLRQGPSALGLLDRWWAYAGNGLYPSCAHLLHPYEQGEFLCRIFDPETMGVLADDSFSSVGPEQFIIHPCKLCSESGKIPPIHTILAKVRLENNLSNADVTAAAKRTWRGRLLLSGSAAQAWSPQGAA